MSSLRLLSPSAAAVTVLLILSSSAVAQDVQWRRDYAAARKEAAETGRPLLIDLGFEGCIWCRKLDATTFRDPAIVRTLNERFVPVKIDIERDPRIPNALGITGYPTVLVASAQGAIVGRHDGYADVAQLTALLTKAATPARPVATPTAASAGAESKALALQARAHYDAGRYAECLRLCRELVAAAPESDSARQLVKLIANDAAAQRRVTEQIEANLEALRPKLTAALE